MDKSRAAESRGNRAVCVGLSVVLSVVMLGNGAAWGAAAKKKRDPNPPSKAKMKVAKWPGLVTIFHGVNWGEDKKYITAIKEAHFGASGAASSQINDVVRRGLRAFVFIWPFEMTDRKLPAKLRKNKAVLGYFMSDRIHPSKWGTWAGYEKSAYEFDPYHPAVFTMTPRAWGGIDRYLPVTRARLIEYYHYHWDGGRSPQNHFLYLEMYRKESAKHGHVPICRLVETRPEDMRKTSQTIFTSLAYGVRGFRYGGALFDTNKRDKRGVPTPNVFGKAAKRINMAIKAFSPIFKTARSVDVFQTPPLPPGTKEAPKDYWVRPSGEHVVMGEFINKKKTRFLVLANRDHTKDHVATLTFSETDIKLYKMNKKTGKWRAIKLVKQAAEVKEEEGGKVEGKEEAKKKVKEKKMVIVVKIKLKAGGGELLGVVKKKK